jgi:lipopolysaccharide export system protein LptC
MLALSNCVEELQQTSGDNTNRATGLSKPDTPENKSEVTTEHEATLEGKHSQINANIMLINEGCI